jgi:HK97 gp10 family phage protein
MAKAQNRLVVVTGIKELDAKLKTLAPRVQRKVVRQSLRAAAKPIQARAKHGAPEGETGKLRASIKVRAGKTKRRDVIAIDVLVDKKDFDGMGWHGAAVEFGTSKMDAQPYMLPAFVQQGPSARDYAERLIRDGIEREAAKGGGS